VHVNVHIDDDNEQKILLLKDHVTLRTGVTMLKIQFCIRQNIFKNNNSITVFTYFGK